MSEGYAYVTTSQNIYSHFNTDRFQAIDICILMGTDDHKRGYYPLLCSGTLILVAIILVASIASHLVLDEIVIGLRSCKLLRTPLKYFWSSTFKGCSCLPPFVRTNMVVNRKARSVLHLATFPWRTIYKFNAYNISSALWKLIDDALELWFWFVCLNLDSKKRFSGNVTFFSWQEAFFTIACKSYHHAHHVILTPTKLFSHSSFVWLYYRLNH